ncbi:MAG: EAL domain-containing protein [Woeseiaceae bacterium]
MSQTERSDGAGQAVLICSEASAVEVAANAFKSEGYEILIWEVDQPCATFGESPPAVILVDSAVAPKEPLDFCRKVREMPECSYIPLILLTDEGGQAFRDSAYDAQVTTVFTKPLDENDFLRHIQSLGNSGRTISGIRTLRTPQAQLFTTMPDAFFIVGSDGLLRQYMGGGNDDPVLTPEAIEGQMIADIWPNKVSTQVLQNIKRALKSRDGRDLQIELTKFETRCNYEIRLLVQGRDKVLMIIRNLGDGESAHATRGGRNQSDTLTGLTAREVFRVDFDSLISDAQLRERGIAVLCIDIDRFTRINETMGRAVGDQVLQVTAKRIERCLRSSDQLARIDDTESSSLTRISGDEFVLVLADIESRDDVKTVATRVQDAFEEPVNIEGHELKISPSIGISQFPLDGDNADQLLKNARVALDEAKVMSVDGREFYSTTMKYRARKRLDVKNELRWAIDKGQLELHYLPRIDLRTGRVAGLEALLRWMHPLRGSVPLSEVIPLAEATGLIFPIGEWVIKTACEQTVSWHKKSPDLPAVSINLSQQEFTRSDLADIIRETLEDTGLLPEMLELELTEGMLMRNRQAEAILTELSGIGVGIVLDDFGQGHSSIAHLTSLPIKAIKIDRAFIDGVREPGEKQSICAAMIAMSRELGIGVIAEGVESEMQVQFLKERGCDAVQGFLYTEPLPADDVPDFLVACREVAEEASVIDLHTVRQKISIKTAC